MMQLRSLHPRLLPPVLALALLLGSATAAISQTAERSRLALRGGLAAVGTGDEVNCAYAGSIVAGLDLRTRGTWFAALSGDLHLGLPLACADVGTLIPYGEDQWGFLEGGVFYALAPRAGLRLGFAPPRSALEVTIGGGGVLGTELGSSRMSLQPWTSGTAAIRIPNSRWAIQAEYGAHRVMLRHDIYMAPAGVPQLVFLETREVPRWRPLFQLGLRRGG